MKQTSSIEQPVLVTGATGCIGTVLVRKLLEQDIRVKALVLPDDSLPEEWDKRVEVVRGNIVKRSDVETALEGVKTVFHLAAVVTDWGAETIFWDVGVNGSMHLFEYASKQDVRVILASSIVVYGEKVGYGVCDEETPYGSTFGPYSRVKREQEELAWKYFREKNLRVTVVRPANVYGPGSGPWVHQVFDALKKGQFSLVDGGDYCAGLVHVETVTDVMLLVAASEKTIGQVYNICDENGITWKRYFTDLAAIAGYHRPRSIPGFLVGPLAKVVEFIWGRFKLQSHPPLTRESLNLVSSTHNISVEKIKTELNYIPDYPYEKAIEGIGDYYRKYLSGS